MFSSCFFRVLYSTVQNTHCIFSHGCGTSCKIMAMQSLDGDIGNILKASATGWIAVSSSIIHVYRSARRRDPLVSACVLFASAADLVCINAYNWHYNDPPNMFGTVINRLDERAFGWRGTLNDVHSVRPVGSRFWNTNDSVGIGTLEYRAPSYRDVDSFLFGNKLISAEVSYVVQSFVNDHASLCDFTGRRINFAFMDVVRLYFLDSSDIIRTTKLAPVTSWPHRSEEGGQISQKLAFKVSLCILDNNPLAQGLRHRLYATKMMAEGSYIYNAYVQSGRRQHAEELHNV